MESSCAGIEEEKAAGTEMPRMHDTWCITLWHFTRSVFGFPHDRKGMSLVVLIPEGIMNQRVAPTSKGGEEKPGSWIIAYPLPPALIPRV